MQPLSSRLSARLSGWLWPALPGVLRTLAEAGWIYVVYAAASVLADKQSPVIGPIEMFGFVGVGVPIGVFGRRKPAIGAFMVIGGVILGGALGSLAGQDLDALGENWPGALGSHFAGWLAGFAVLRGAVLSIGEKVADQLEQMLRIVPIVLAVGWAYTSFVARPELWLSFAIAAMWGTWMYLSGSMVGIGLARLGVLHAEVSDTRQRRAWRWLVIGVGFAIVPISVPVAVLAGIPLGEIVSPVVGPLQSILSLVAYLFAFIVWILSIIQPVAGPLSELFDQLGRRATSVPQDADAAHGLATIAAALISFLTLLLIALAIYFAARRLLTRRQTPDAEADPAFTDIERAIVLPAAPIPRSTRRRRRLGRPRDAVGAYLSAIDALNGYGELARKPVETPAAHASRLRRLAEVGGVDLARLAATYQLARYGARTITHLENVRAVGRFQRFRRALRASRG